jgi:hypothetical protein
LTSTHGQQPSGDRGEPLSADPLDAEPTPAVVTRRSAGRELDEVFGEVLPDVTRDELDDEGGQRAGASGTAESEGSSRRRLSRRDEELLRDVPPHHG